MTLYVLPIEPMDMRFSIQWTQWFKEVFDSKDVKYVWVDAADFRGLQPDSQSFFKVTDSMRYKAACMAKLLECPIADDDAVLVLDGEYPGLEALEYVRRITGVHFKIFSIWHAGTYDPHDQTTKSGLTRIGQKLEEVLFDICDKIFVSTIFHKNLILASRHVPADKIAVTGLPVDTDTLSKYNAGFSPNRTGVIFAGRKAAEKGYDVIVRFMAQPLAIQGPWMITHDMGLPKQDYYKLLGESRVVVSPSRQETFGYATIEAIMCGCLPVVPNKLCYPEYIPPFFRCFTEKDMKETIEVLCDDKKVLHSQEALEWCQNTIREKYEYHRVIERMIVEMRSCGANLT